MLIPTQNESNFNKLIRRCTVLPDRGGGSNEGDAIAKVLANIVAVDPLAQSAAQISKDSNVLYKASVEDLSNTLARLTADQAVLRATLDDLMAEQSSVAVNTKQAAERHDRVTRMIRGY